ncbi:MAG: carboxypeptidase regulatory-like domain-containing protein [Phycisphaerae bacterium]|nr:carboxypeptidase regulatory-like domain-containing protein [Phycisphaerae bacterium]
MDRLITLIEGPSCKHLLTALLHTLWQGASISAILFAILTRLPATQANRRYIATLVALCAVVLSGLLTWSILNYDPAQSQVSSSSAVASTQTVQQEAESIPRVMPPTMGPPISQPPAKQVGQPWQTWALGVWLTGTFVMLLRMAMTLVGARQLRGQCHDLEQPDILSLIDSLCTQMHVTRRVRVLVSEHLSVPGVIGCIWPTLLLPVSVTTGMPVDDLKAILTHELAHIKRYDYLVNVFQMVIEALLFFNPAVWWISRQIRIEREACCDATSIAATGQRLKYAEMLVAWTSQLRHNTLAPGVTRFAGQENGSHLVDRIKRIISIEHRPRLYISWPMAGVTIGVSLICLIALWQGTNLAVSVAARVLTPQERIEKLKEIAESYGYEPGRDPKENSIQISGMIRTWNGEPLPGRISTLLDVESGQNSSISNIGTSRLDGRPDAAEFRIQVARGHFWLMASAKGYATAAVGPLVSQPGRDISDIELVLDKGFPGRIKVVNESGDPIGQASLRGGYTLEHRQSYTYTIELSTDEQGLCTEAHASGQTMTLNIAAQGYEPKTVESLILDAQETTVITLKEVQPIAGTVVSGDTGLPIHHAEVRLLILRKKTQSKHLNQVDSTPDVFTDQNGFFQLEQVQQGWQHMIHVTAKDYGHVYLEDLPAGKQDLRIELGPKQIIRGTVLGDLSQLETDASGQPAVTFKNEYRGYGAHHAMAPVSSKETVNGFEITDVWGQTVTLKAGYKEITLKPEEDDLDNIVIDLSPSVTREIVLQFDIPDNMPSIQGQVRIDRIKERMGNTVRSQYPEWVKITDNRASFTNSAPGQFRYSLDPYKELPLGYWFEKSKYIDVTPGTEPMVINVPVYPAGALYGKILRPDGTLAKEANVSLRVIETPAVIKNVGFSLSNIVSNRTSLGTYNATPLPLGGTYAIMAYEGYAFAITEPFTLDQATPMIEANLQLPKGVTVTGQLLDPEGKPATNTVSLHVSVKRGKASSGLGGTNTEPDENGRFVFEDVNAGPGGSCTVRVIGHTGFRPAKQEIKDLNEPVIIQLERGHRMTGTVIDQATGWPVPGLEVYAQSAKNAQGDFDDNWELLETDAKTDAKGQFEFTNMGSGFYRLGVRGVNMASPNILPVVIGGQKEPVTLHVTLLPWSELKPTKPE